jgi:putative methionine-R-sulfoxide reductase with GAF domain
MSADQFVAAFLQHLDIPAVWLFVPEGEHLVRRLPSNPALKVHKEEFYGRWEEGVFIPREELPGTCLGAHAHFLPPECGAHAFSILNDVLFVFAPEPVSGEKFTLLRDFFLCCEENRRTEGRLEESELINQTILAIHRLFVGEMNLADLLPKVLASLQASLHYTNSAILLLDDENHHLRIMAAINYFDALVRTYRAPLGRGITGWCALHGEVVNIPDVRKDNRYIHGAEGIRSELVIPLKLGNRVIGVLDVESTEVGFFSDRDLRILEPVAHIIAATIENARLYGALQSAHGDLQESFFQSAEAIAEAVEAKDSTTHGHIQRSTYYGITLARLLNLDERRIENVRLGSMLHDVGKIGIPEAILLKPGPLTPGERLEMEKHVEIGANILKRIKRLNDIVPIVMAHQERWDGDTGAQYHGYPNGLKGEQLPIEARIVTVVDAFDAMTSDRPYRSRMPVKQAIDRIEKEAGHQFDPKVAAIFARWLKENQKQ